MGHVNITLPLMGEGITDATITKYLVKEGDFVSVDTPLVEVATDKVDSEVPSFCAGKVIQLTRNVGDVIPVGQVLLIIESDSVTETPTEISSGKVEEKQFTTYAIPKENLVKENDEGIAKKFLSPLVKQLMNEYSITMAEVDHIAGSGIGGKITKEDVLKYIQNKEQVKIATTEIKKVSVFETKESIPVKPEITYLPGEVEVVEMDRMRRLISEHMVHSVHTAPHVTSFIEIDVTRIVEWRNKAKDEFLKKHGEKLTFLPVFIESTVMAIKDFPLINVSVDDTRIIIKKNIHVGIATALPSGNLIVPVIKNADQKNLIGLAKSLNDLASRARENKLLPDEIKGGTFTITNLGSFGTLAGTPIINQPEAAILGIGEIRKMPAVIETPAGDAIAIRHKVILSLTFDHRVIDGALAGTFLQKINETLQNFDILRKF